MGEGPEALAHLGDDVPLFVESLRELPAEYPEQLEGEAGGVKTGLPGADELVMPS